MGAKQSQTPRFRSCSDQTSGNTADGNQPSTSNAVHRRARPRNFEASRFSAPNTPSGGGVLSNGAGGLHDDDLDDLDEQGRISVDNLFRNLMATSLPMRFLQINSVRCPLCSRVMSSDQFDVHIEECYQKPRINYNEEMLAENRNVECAICLDTLDAGNVIARLPCLCVYHKSCIDCWFKKNRSCPEHPSD